MTLDRSMVTAEPGRALFGRDEDLARASGWLDEGARLVTVTGPAGIGKSAFARALVEARRGARAPGAPAAEAKVSAVDLSTAKDRPGALRRIARAAGLPARLRGDAIASALAAAHSVLLMDDADPVIGPLAAFARTYIDAKGAGGGAMVVTPREPLGIDGERVLLLGPLSDDASAALFALRSGAPLGAEDAAALRQVVEGIPLAIELAAARAPLLSPRELLARHAKHGERVRLLRSERRDIPERHATLDLAVSWSLDLLPKDELRAFVALGVFAGPCTLDAFETVAGAMLASDPIDCAQALLRKSLVTRATSSGATHLSMMATLREIARLRGADDPDVDAAHARHAEHYAGRAEEAARLTYGSRAEAALAELETALPELLAAFAWAENARPAVAARIAIALADLVLFRDAIDLRTSFFDRAVAAADASNLPALRAGTRLLRARVLLETQRTAEARPALDEAARIADDAGEASLAADVGRSTGWAALALGDADGARAAFDRVMPHYVARNDARGRADVLAALGVLACIGGDIEGGRGALAASRDIHVARKETIRRDKVDEMARLFGLSIARDGGVDDLGPEGAELEAQLRASLARHGSQGRTLREAIDRVHLAALESRAAPPSAPATWNVGEEARWIASPGSERIDLARHGSLRVVLDALVTSRIEAPGAALSADALLAAGWPGERVLYDAGMLRVYTAVRRLRKLGLGNALLTRDDGYLLDPHIRFTRAPARN